MMREKMEGRKEGKRTRGRPWKGVLDELLVNDSYVKMMRRESWRG